MTKPIKPICPKCGYDQSGEIAIWETRCPLHGTCPECGLGFAWADVMDSSRTRLAWYIEHATTMGRMMHRTLPTLWMLLIPNRFWRRLTLARLVDTPRAWRWLGALCLFVYIGSVLVHLSAQFFLRHQMNLGNAAMVAQYPQLMNRGGLSQTNLLKPSFWVERAIDSSFFPLFGRGEFTIGFRQFMALLIGFTVVWVVILAVVPITRSLAKLRRIHVERAVVMSLVPGPLLIGMGVLADAVSTIRMGLRYNNTNYAMLDLLTTALPFISAMLLIFSALWVQWFWIAAIRIGWKIRPSWLLILLGFIASCLGGLAGILYATLY